MQRRHIIAIAFSALVLGGLSAGGGVGYAAHLLSSSTISVKAHVAKLATTHTPSIRRDSAAVSQYGPPSTVTVTLSGGATFEVPIGSTYTVSFGGFPPGATVNVSVGGVTVATLSADSSGFITFTITMTDPHISINGGPARAISSGLKKMTVSGGGVTKTVTLAVPLMGTAQPPAGFPRRYLGTPTTRTTLVSGVLSETRGAATVVVPSGALSPGSRVSLYPIKRAGLGYLKTKAPKRNAYVAGFAVSWKTTNKSLHASKPVTLTIHDKKIVKGETLWAVSGKRLVKVGTAKANGVATVSFTRARIIAVAKRR